MANITQKVTGSVGLDVDTIGIASEYRATDVPLGTLNPYYTQSQILKETFGVSGRSLPTVLALVKHSAEKIGQIDSMFAPAGPYRGVVLRIDSQVGGKEESDETSLERTSNIVNTESSKYATSARYVVRVRIPELHQNIPIPATIVDAPVYNKSAYENLSESAEPCTWRMKIDNDIVNQYPRFVGYAVEGEGSSVPQIGSIIVVDFENRLMQQGGFVVGGMSATDKLYPTTRSLYNKAFNSFSGNKKLDSPSSKITNSAKGQFETPDPSEETQVPTPAPIPVKQKNEPIVPLGDYPIVTPDEQGLQEV